MTAPGRLLVAALVAVAATHCTSVRTTPEIHYYVLAVPPDGAPRLPAPVRVGSFTIDDPYATRQLAYRTSPYRLAYYNYHRWAGNPEVVVAAAVREYLEHAGAESEPTPLELGARIRRLEEVDEGERWSGALALELTVHRRGVLVLERTYSETEPAASRNPEAVAAALSRALQRVLDALAAELAALDLSDP